MLKGLPKVFNEQPEKSTMTSAIESQRRLIKFHCALERDMIDKGEIRRLALEGLPNDPNLRRFVWEIFLGFLPLETLQWKQYFSEKLIEYQQYREDAFKSHSEAGADETNFLTTEMIEKAEIEQDNITDDPLSSAGVWTRLRADAALIDRIHKDTIRTRRAEHFFDENTSPENQKSLTRMLFIYGKLNRNIGYVQGMNEIIAVIFYVMKEGRPFSEQINAESECFFCFSLLMQKIGMNFIAEFDERTEGISNTLKQIETFIKIHNRQLSNALTLKKIDLNFFCFRWIVLLFTQEFDLETVIWMWDRILSEKHIVEFAAAISCSLILNVKEFIYAKPFPEIIALLQHYPAKNLDKLVEKAQEFKYFFGFNALHPNQSDQQINSSSFINDLLSQTRIITPFKKHLKRQGNNDVTSSELDNELNDFVVLE